MTQATKDRVPRWGLIFGCESFTFVIEKRKTEKIFCVCVVKTHRVVVHKNVEKTVFEYFRSFLSYHNFHKKYFLLKLHFNSLVSLVFLQLSIEINKLLSVFA